MSSAARDLRVHHRTVYRFKDPVGLSPHRLMLRPRESRELRLMTHELTIDPIPAITWAHDVFGNSVAMATFSTMKSTLVIDSVSDITLTASAWPIFPIDASAISYPFRYPDDDWADLGTMTVPQYPDQAGQLHAWALDFVRGNPTDTLSLLRDLNAGVAQHLRYESREVEGTQSPGMTLDRRSGSCRDFAVLFTEAARKLGFGARIVSGYLHDPNNDLIGSAESGSTHAWAEVFVPGAGWITFDPTNRSVGGGNLVPVAVARHIGQCTPVSGSFFGAPDASLGMDVTVTVSSRDSVMK